MGCTPFFYPSSLWSFNKKENYFQCSGSLGKGSKHTRAGQRAAVTESSFPIPAQHTQEHKNNPYLPSSLQVCVCI